MENDSSITPLCVVSHKEFPDHFEYRFYTDKKTFFWETNSEQLENYSELLHQYWENSNFITQLVDDETQTEDINLKIGDSIDSILELQAVPFSSVFSQQRPETSFQIPSRIISCNLSDQTADVIYLHSNTQTTIPIDILKRSCIVSYAQFLLEEYKRKINQESS